MQILKEGLLVSKSVCERQGEFTLSPPTTEPSPIHNQKYVVIKQEP